MQGAKPQPYFMYCKVEQRSGRCFLVEFDSTGDLSDTPKVARGPQADAAAGLCRGAAATSGRPFYLVSRSRAIGRVRCFFRGGPAPGAKGLAAVRPCAPRLAAGLPRREVPRGRLWPCPRLRRHRHGGRPGLPRKVCLPRQRSAAGARPAGSGRWTTPVARFSKKRIIE